MQPLSSPTTQPKSATEAIGYLQSLPPHLKAQQAKELSLKWMKETLQKPMNASTSHLMSSKPTRGVPDYGKPFQDRSLGRFKIFFLFCLQKRICFAIFNKKNIFFM